jgi:hypothetical protein
MADADPVVNGTNGTNEPPRLASVTGSKRGIALIASSWRLRVYFEVTVQPPAPAATGGS